MRNKNNDEPRDEFDHIMIPAFIARPFERLGSRPAPAAPGERSGERLPDGSPADESMPRDPDAPGADDEQPAPRAWWAGYRGKLLLYGVGTVVMVFLQSRG